MRFLALLMLAASIVGADVRPLAPNEDLPWCRVVLNMAATIDTDSPKYEAHDGWWCAPTRQLFPLSDKGYLFGSIGFDPVRVVSVTQAAASPGHMPATFRREVNTFIAKNRPQLPNATANAPR